MSNILKYQRAERSRPVASAQADYQAALDLSLLFSTEVDLHTLLEKVLTTASSLVSTCCGLEFEPPCRRNADGSVEAAIPQLLLGKKAHHSMTFLLSHHERKVGRFTFYNRTRTSEEELESIEDLISIVIQPLHIALRLHKASQEADARKQLLQNLERQLAQKLGALKQRRNHEDQQALLLTRIDCGEDWEPARTRLMETLSRWEEDPWLEICDEYTLATLVRADKALWAAERIRLLVAAAAEANPRSPGPTVTITIANLRDPCDAEHLLEKSMSLLNRRGSNRGNQIVKLA